MLGPRSSQRLRGGCWTVPGAGQRFSFSARSTGNYRANAGRKGRRGRRLSQCPSGSAAGRAGGRGLPLERRCGVLPGWPAVPRRPAECGGSRWSSARICSRAPSSAVSSSWAKSGDSSARFMSLCLQQCVVAVAHSVPRARCAAVAMWQTASHGWPPIRPSPRARHQELRRRHPRVQRAGLAGVHRADQAAVGVRSYAR